MASGNKKVDDSGTAKKTGVDKLTFMYMICACMAISFGTGFTTSRSAAQSFGNVDSPSSAGDNARETEATSRRIKVGKKNEHVVEQIHMNFENPSTEFFSEKTSVESAPTMYEILKSDKGRLPAGQQLLVDLKNIDATFLNSEELLTKAIVGFADDSEYTLMSFSCNALSPVGVSCIVMLLESHFSLHTWPDEGIITIDLFTSGSDSLIPDVAHIKRNFGVACTDSSGKKEEMPEMWGHGYRGFAHGEDVGAAHHFEIESDLNSYVTSSLDTLTKNQVTIVKSPFQTIEVWDCTERDDTPTYDDAVKHNLQPGDPRYNSPDVATGERMLFLDESVQVFLSSSEECHEVHVHPGMLCHPDPQNVAVIGGGDGAILREVLKHNSVKQVKVVEIDSMVIDVSKQYLPQLSNCSDFVGFEGSCFDDPRTDVVITDAVKYFTENFGREKEGVFDVIVSDALFVESPNNILSKDIYTNEEFVSAVMKSLTPDGIFVVQVGSAPGIHDPKETKGRIPMREKVMSLFEKDPGTSAVFVYETPNCGFDDSVAFMVVCKSTNCRKHWYASSDMVDLKIHDRVHPRKSGQPTIMNYDGASQYRFQYTPKAWETLYCRREPQPAECSLRGLNFDANVHEVDDGKNENASLFIKEQKNGEKGVFTNVDIKKGDYIMPTDMSLSASLSMDGTENLKKKAEVVEKADETASGIFADFFSFIENNGHDTVYADRKISLIEVGASRFIREMKSVKKSNVGSIFPREKGSTMPTYSPVHERYGRLMDVFLVATKDIASGQELLKAADIWG